MNHKISVRWLANLYQSYVQSLAINLPLSWLKPEFESLGMMSPNSSLCLIHHIQRVVPSYLKNVFLASLRVGLHHGPWSRTMEDGLFPWSNFMVWFLKNVNLQSFWAPHWVWTECGSRRMAMHQKVSAMIFLIYVPKRQFWREKKIQLWSFFCLHLLFTKKNII